MFYTIHLKETGDKIELNLIQFLARLFHLRQADSPPVYVSSVYGFNFDYFKEYWQELARRNTLIELLALQKQKGPKGIRGFSFEELLQKAAATELGTGIGVILWNINTITLGRMLDRFQGMDATIFNEDYVVIPAQTREQARKLLDRIPETLAEAVAIDRGHIFAKNYK